MYHKLAYIQEFVNPSDFLLSYFMSKSIFGYVCFERLREILKIKIQVESFKWLVVPHVQLCDFGSLGKSKVEISSCRRANIVNRGDLITVAV